MKHQFITEIEVPQKTGIVRTRWAIIQLAPYPLLRVELSTLRWTNISFASRDNPKLEPEYECALLHTGWTPENAMHNREDHAGYNSFHMVKGIEGPLPGTLVYRGVDLGELLFTVTRDGQVRRWRAHGGYEPTPGQYRWLKEMLEPPLLKAIDENKTDLYNLAIADLDNIFKDQLRDKRQELEACEEEAKNLISKLWKPLS